MPKKIICLVLILAMLAISIPKGASAQFGIGEIKSIIDSITTAIGFINLPSRLNVLGYIPHNFPFGGPILTHENACTLRFRIWFQVCIFGACAMVPTPTFSTIRFGDAVRIGDPVPITPPTTVPYGRAITFPFISDTYDNQTHDRSGPWALGLGFTPFPLDKINDSLKDIRFPAPSQVQCSVPYIRAWCVDNISISCLDSGETDQDGDPIYKVIRLLGTSKDNAPSSAFPQGYPR